MQGDSSNPKVPIYNNYRPTQPAHQRPVRTNINFHNPVSDSSAISVFASKGGDLAPSLGGTEIISQTKISE